MVWVAVLTTILSITGVILVSTKIFQTNSASGLLANTLLSICQSVVDQPSSFRKHKALSLKSILWMLTTWHFLSMVLSNYYKSKLLCAFVQPILVSSPKTLISLVEQSELKIHTLWYSGYIEDILRQKIFSSFVFIHLYEKFTRLHSSSNSRRRVNALHSLTKIRSESSLLFTHSSSYSSSFLVILIFNFILIQLTIFYHTSHITPIGGDCISFKTQHKN